ncbi:NrfD/PsrC family molybdoenzyme membrane anchor subunit [Gordonibacter sp.]|uniref:NrfD/PsrC family molybdoenzyme membrane anchor subunit n=1 Tax=Gordonibacter sp. TaxID=1968902 RepID=UPI002FC8332E
MVLQTIWGWQPALYLFLGGMGAGAFVMAAVLYLLDQKRHAKIVCISMWASAICLGVGLLLLLSELIQPARGLMMWQSFSHFTSWMTYGAWGAFAAIAVFGVSAVLATAKVGKKCVHDEKQAKRFVLVRKVLALVGIALGVFVAVYTGMLLMMAPGVPLWNTPLLPCLFAVSGIDTGVALVEIVAVLLAKKDPLAPRARVLMEGIVVGLVAMELVVLGAFLLSMAGGEGSVVAATAAQSVELLTSGILAPYFWGLVVVCGLVLPLVVAIVGLVPRKKHADTPMAVGAAGAIVGGCALRFLMLAAGLHANVVAETVINMIG